MLDDVDRITKVALEEAKPPAVALDSVDFFVPDSPYQECVVKYTDNVCHIPGTFVENEEEAKQA